MINRCLLLVSAVILLHFGCSEESPEARSPHRPQVTVARPLVRQVVEWERYTGRLQPVETVNVQARVSGHLQSAHFEEGEIIQKGNLLVTIDPRPFEVAVASTEASLEEAKANLRRSEALLLQAKAQRNEAVAAERLSKIRLENAQHAASTNSIAREQVDVRQSEHAQAQARTASAVAAVSSAEAEIATSNAAILAAQAALDNARLDLEYTKIHAPIDGRISRLLVTKGNLIQGGGANATLLTTIVSIDPIYVFIEASEQDLLRYLRQTTLEERLSHDLRHPLYLALLDDVKYPHAGQIDFAENSVNQNTGTLRLRGILRNEDLTLIPGMFATVQIPATMAPDVEAILIPDEAIGADQSQRIVLVVDQDNVVQPRPIAIGPLIDGLRVVRSGLDGTERIVISGLQRVMPGIPVQPVEGEFESTMVDDGLPDTCTLIPREQWITLPKDPLPTQRPGHHE